MLEKCAQVAVITVSKAQLSCTFVVYLRSGLTRNSYLVWCIPASGENTKITKGVWYYQSMFEQRKTKFTTSVIKTWLGNPQFIDNLPSYEPPKKGTSFFFRI